MRQTQVLQVFIHAGGASKTSTVRDVGYELSRRGKKVLLIDLDPQGNLTEWLGVDNVQPEQTVKDALEKYQPLPEPVQVHGMDLIPSHIDLAYTDVSIAGLRKVRALRVKVTSFPVRCPAHAEQQRGS